MNGKFDFGPLPSKRQTEWYQRGLMAFFHFGMNTFTNREWGEGDDSPENFDPKNLDCRQWVRAIKEAGFASAIITAKHHDGFCMWPSKYTDYSVKNSPYKGGKGDVVKEFTDACREFGIKAGVYLSPWDRHEKSYGTPGYSEYYNNQLKELLTNYGPIWDVWWDGAGSAAADYDWGLWENTVHSLQPQAVIFGAVGAADYADVRWVGNEKGVAGKPCWANIDPEYIRKEITKELNRGAFEGSKFVPAEVDVSIRPGWFYHKEQDDFVRSSENLMNLWFNSIGRNAGLLLNLPPDTEGLISDIDIKSVTEFSKKLRDTFSENLLTGARVKADEAIAEEYGAENLIKDDGSFYAAEKLPTVVYEFNKEIVFNTIKLSEAIEHGHHIKGFEISALIDGEFAVISKGECVGNCYAETLSDIKTTAVKLRVTDAAAVPLLRFFGIYNRKSEEGEQGRKFKRDILKNASAKINETKGELDINLGGIYPFNCIKLDSSGLISYELLIFDGSQLNSLGTFEAEGDVTYHRFSAPVDYAYRLVLKLKEQSNYEFVSRNVEIYLED